MLELVRDLSLALRGHVLPSLGAHAARAHDDGAAAAGGDVTFAIDAEAEAFLEAYLAEHAPGVAFYSEDRGLVEPAAGSPGRCWWWTPSTALVPPSPASSRAACRWPPRRSTASPPWPTSRRPAWWRSRPARSSWPSEGPTASSDSPAVRLSPNERLDRMFWTYGFRGRPARALTEVIAELIDVSSVAGGTFDLGSAAFDMTRVVTGQLDAYVEPGPRMIADVPGMREEFERVGHGAVLNNSPYDLAAAALVLEQAGAVVTDAYGAPLGGRPLLGSGEEFQMSIVASANRTLHTRILREVDVGIARLLG